MLVGKRFKLLLMDKPSDPNTENSVELPYPFSLSFVLIVLKSIGCLMYFLYWGNCFVLTGCRNGQLSSCFSISGNNTLKHRHTRTASGTMDITALAGHLEMAVTVTNSEKKSYTLLLYKACHSYTLVFRKT